MKITEEDLLGAFHEQLVSHCDNCYLIQLYFWRQNQWLAWVVQQNFGSGSSLWVVHQSRWELDQLGNFSNYGIWSSPIQSTQLVRHLKNQKCKWRPHKGHPPVLLARLYLVFLKKRLIRTVKAFVRMQIKQADIATRKSSIQNGCGND